MTHKRIAMIAVASLVIVAVAAFAIWTTVHSDEGSSGEIYYCPMHPTITADRPGNCPICGMKLVKKNRAPSAAASQAADAGGLGNTALSPSERVLANVKTEPVRVAGVSAAALKAPGRVTVDERRVAQVTAYASGRIERLYADFTGAFIQRGAAVAKIYSPELFTAQQEYLLAIRNRERMKASGFASARGASEDLVESGRRKLILLGMTQEEIARIARLNVPLYTVTVAAPVSGIVTRKLVVPQQYVAAGQPLLEVADLSVVWVEADVFEQDIASVAPGQAVRLTLAAMPGVEISGRVAFVQPVLAGATRSARVRVEVPNQGLKLKPEMFATVHFEGNGAAAERLSVPSSAVIDRGAKQYVWVETSPGAYSPRHVVVGRRGTERTEILSGVQVGERVVIDGAFLLDADAQLRSANGGAHESH